MLQIPRKVKQIPNTVKRNGENERPAFSKGPLLLEQDQGSGQRPVFFETGTQRLKPKLSPEPKRRKYGKF